MENQNLSHQELNDEALDQVVGAGELKVQTTGGHVITTCDSFTCVWCGCGKSGGSGHHCKRQGGLEFPDISWFDYTCNNCAKLYSCPNANRRTGIALPPK